MGKRLKRQVPLYLANDTIAQLNELTKRRDCTQQKVLREAVDNMLRSAGLLSSSSPAVAAPAAVEPPPTRRSDAARLASAKVASLEFEMMGSVTRSLERSGSTDRPLRTVDELLAKAKELGLQR